LSKDSLLLPFAQRVHGVAPLVHADSRRWPDLQPAAAPSLLAWLAWVKVSLENPLAIDQHGENADVHSSQLYSRQPFGAGRLQHPADGCASADQALLAAAQEPVPRRPADGPVGSWW